MTEERIAIETQYMFDHLPLFSPLGSDLTIWRGMVEGLENEYKVEVKIPPTYPTDPPKITLEMFVKDARGSRRKSVNLNVENWNTNKKHVYQVIMDVKKMLEQNKINIWEHPPEDQREEIESRKRMTVHEEKNRMQKEIRTKENEIGQLQRVIKEKEVKVQEIIKNTPEDKQIETTHDVEAEIISLQKNIEYLKQLYRDTKISTVDYFHLLRRYTVRKELLKIEETWVDSRKRERNDRVDEHKAEFIGCVVTLHQISMKLKHGEIDIVAYQRYYQFLAKELIKLYTQLVEKDKINVHEFLAKYDSAEKMNTSVIIKSIISGEQEGDIFSPFQRDLPEKAADFVTSAIEISDLLRLKTVAKVEFVLPLLDTLKLVTEGYPGLGKKSDMTQEIVEFIKILEQKNPTELIEGALRENLELNTARWLNKFKIHLKESQH